MTDKTLRGGVIPALVLLAWFGLACGGESTPSTPEAEAPAPEMGEQAAAPPATSPPPSPPARPMPQRPERQPILEPRPIAGEPMPPSFPQDLPVPDGAEMVAAFDGGEVRSIVAWEADGSTDALVQDLKSRYEQDGWEVTMAETHGQEGLVFASKGPHAIMTAIRPADSGRTTVETTSLRKPQ